MNFNLIDVLTPEDRTKIENYISLYGTTENFIGLDNWLKYWSPNKIKMYKLLNNQLIYKVPFQYKKPQAELEIQIRNLTHTHEFPDKLFNWLELNKDIIPTEVRDYIYNCCGIFSLFNDRVSGSIKFKLEDSNKTLQLQNGIKPIRALNRFLTYCKNIEDVDSILKSYESFRLAHSVILNDRMIKGSMSISIHPLDFMTMSDNNSNWESCMSWQNSGCYHAGTIEMMNSNNVLCCYIENERDPYYFSKENHTEDYRWNNKKWRQLVYFNKDIIVGGKAYPYNNDEITKALIEIIRTLAKENLHWTYNFGPELYKDMQYINSDYSMSRAKNYIRYKNTKKHNILFDTKGMYNDMINDNYTNYWCVRNKVKSNKIFSYSGKAPCLCCGEPIVYYTGSDDYNERYGNSGSSVCLDCLEKFRCEVCREENPTKKYYTIILENGAPKKLCAECVKYYIKKCPDCGNPTFIDMFGGYYSILRDEEVEYPKIFIRLQDDEEKLEYEIGKSFYSYNLSTKENADREFKTIYPVFKCGHCAKKDPRFSTVIKTVGQRWARRTDEFLLSTEVQKKEEWEKYFPYNLEDITLEDGLFVTG